MSAIDIGYGAADYDSFRGQGYTTIDKNNPANDTGTLTSVEVFMYMADCTTASFYWGTFSNRTSTYFTSQSQSSNLGKIASGSKQTFTGQSVAVTSGHYIGAYWTSNGDYRIEASGITGSIPICVEYGNFFGSGEKKYNTSQNRYIGLYATGETAAVGNPYHYYLQQ
jgi:hypothetical protein